MMNAQKTAQTDQLSLKAERQSSILIEYRTSTLGLHPTSTIVHNKINRVYLRTFVLLY